MWEPCVEVDLGGWKPQQGANLTVKGLGAIGLVEGSLLATQSREPCVEVDLGGWKPQQGANLTVKGLGAIGLVEGSVLATQSSP